MNGLASNQVAIDEVVCVSDLRMNDRFTDDQMGDKSAGDEWVVIYKDRYGVEAIRVGSKDDEESALFENQETVSITKVVCK